MYGILAVEDGNELYQILGEVASWTEAAEMARCYEQAAGPDNPDTPVPPSMYVIHRRNANGAYTEREAFSIIEGGAAVPLSLMEAL